MPRDNLPRVGRGRQVRIRWRVQVRGYHNIKNKHNKSGGGYQNNKSELKFYPHTAVRQHTTTYDSVKKKIIKNTQKSHEQGFEVSKTLRNREKTDFNDDSIRPSSLVINETDEAPRQAEQDGMDYLYKYEIDECMRRKKNMEII